MWRGRSRAAVETLSTGFAALDAGLPGGGWPRHGLVEILTPQPGVGELYLLLPVLAALSRTTPARWCTWVSPPHEPYAPALESHGVALDRMLVVRTHLPLWAHEQALRSGACGMALAWLPRASPRAIRRLQLAAEQGRALGVLFRSQRFAHLASPGDVAGRARAHEGAGPARRAPDASSRAAAAAVCPSMSPGPRPRHELVMQHPRSYRLNFPILGRSATPSVLRVRPASPPPKGPDSQAALKLEPRELWVAAHVPQLALLALRRPGTRAPLVVVDSDDHNQRIIDADAQAQAEGVRPGMTLAAALAAAPHIEPRAARCRA